MAPPYPFLPIALPIIWLRVIAAQIFRSYPNRTQEPFDNNYNLCKGLGWSIAYYSWIRDNSLDNVWQILRYTRGNLAWTRTETQVFVKTSTYNVTCYISNVQMPATGRPPAVSGEANHLKNKQQTDEQKVPPCDRTRDSMVWCYSYSDYCRYVESIELKGNWAVKLFKALNSGLLVLHLTSFDRTLCTLKDSMTKSQNYKASTRQYTHLKDSFHRLVPVNQTWSPVAFAILADRSPAMSLATSLLTTTSTRSPVKGVRPGNGLS